MLELAQLREFNFMIPINKFCYASFFLTVYLQPCPRVCWKYGYGLMTVASVKPNTASRSLFIASKTTLNKPTSMFKKRCGLFQIETYTCWI